MRTSNVVLNLDNGMNVALGFENIHIHRFGIHRCENLNFQIWSSRGGQCFLTG